MRLKRRFKSSIETRHNHFLCKKEKFLMYRILATLLVLFFTNCYQNTFAQTNDSTGVFEESSGETTSEEESTAVKDIFESTRIINGHSTETLRKGVLEFRVEHRFGDIAGSDGGVQNMFGFDNSSDIRLAFEYGITNDLMVGFGRSKGTGMPYRSLLDGFVKYKILEQHKKGCPIALTGIATTTYTYMKASEDLSQVSSFPEWQHRFAYVAQLAVARKFGERIALALLPTMVHRNYVGQNDVNTLFALGGALRFPITRKVGILVEYYNEFQDDDVRQENTNSMGIAVEWITFGHNFTINLTNSKGFGETQFIPYTFEQWSKGQFRLGFCVGRKFERE